jgi:hypothetical protein
LEEAGLTHCIAVTAAVLSRCGNVVDGHIGHSGSRVVEGPCRKSHTVLFAPRLTGSVAHEERLVLAR